MDYKNFTPTYSYRHIHILDDERNLGTDILDAIEYWTSKILQTHLKIKKLYGVMYDEMSNPVNVGSMDYELLDKVIDLKSKVGMWSTTGEDNGHYRRRNMNTNSKWEYVEDTDAFEGIPYDLWLYQGAMIVLPSKETIEWLNELAYLFCVSNKETV